jgi:hypothetical protein
MLVLLLVSGLYAIIIIISTNYQNINNLWLVLSPLTRINYYNNDVTVLSYIYYWKTIITGILYLSLVITGTLAMVFSYQLFFAINDQWRPQMRSKVKDETALRFIDFYKTFNKDYKLLGEIKDDIIPLNNEETNKLILNEENNKSLGIIKEEVKEDHKEDKVEKDDIEKNKENIPVSDNNIDNNSNLPGNHYEYGSNIPLQNIQMDNLNNPENADNNIDEPIGKNEEGPKKRKIRRNKK